MDIKHVVVLMLENRSFDCMLGQLYPASAAFDGLTGQEANIWHRPDGSAQSFSVWTEKEPTPRMVTIPNPDPGERFSDINMQIFGLPQVAGASDGAANMSGFVDNYMRQPATMPAAEPDAAMHYFSPEHVPVITQLARAFGVSDRWHASAPCQTWPNRFFAHTATAHGYVNNSPPRFPYLMETVFNRLSQVGKDWRIYFHDIPQSLTLTRIWGEIGHFRRFVDHFAQDAAAGSLPAYSFIEPRYFTDDIFHLMPNDQHPPHNVIDGEILIATVYNALRAGPGWKNTMLVITYDEHGGCFDHVAPPAATSPGGDMTDGFAFDRFGVRVPAVIVSPYMRAGSIVRPSGSTAFDHTSIIATLRRLHGFSPLTARDAAAPDLLGALTAAPDNDGPTSITVPAAPATAAQVASLSMQLPNDLQQSLCTLARHLPEADVDVGTHITAIRQRTTLEAAHVTVGNAAAEVADRMRAFLARA